MFANYAFIISTLLINTTHALYYLNLKTRNPLRLLLMSLVMVAAWPLSLWLHVTWPLLTPVSIVGYVAFCMWLYRVFATNDSYTRIFLCGSLILASTQTTRLTLMLLLVNVFGMSMQAAVATITWLHPVLFLAATPLLLRHVRSKVMRTLDLAENQKWFLVGLPPIILTVMGGLANAVLAQSPELVLVNVMAILMPLSIVAYFVSMYLFLVNHHDKTVLGQRLAASERLGEAYEFYDRQLAEKEARLQRLRHDFRHLVLHLEELAREQDCDGILRELAAVSAVSGQTAIKPFCENRTVNAVVSSHFSQAEKYGVNCVAKAYVPDKLAVSKADISMVLGNALENSVKGAGPLAERGYISFEAKPSKQYIVFRLTNNYDPGNYATGKKVGLTSIRHVCEQYHGRLEVTDSDGMFSLVMFLLAL